jgi:HK97 gp10 family phage protein
MSSPLVEITGFAELQRKLILLADDKKKKAPMLRVLRKVAQGTIKAAKRNAPVSKQAHLISGKRTRKIVQPKNLSKSIGAITGKKGAAKTNPTIYVGPRTKGINDGFYGNFVEYGHNIYSKGFKRKRSASAKAKAHNAGGAKSRTTAIPFMRDTYDQTKGQVTAEAEKGVVAFIQKEINKLSTR